MIGLGLIAHFGLFHLMALIWNRLGANVEPIINYPFYSVSLTDFWSNRWNLLHTGIYQEPISCTRLLQLWVLDLPLRWYS
ncbi:MAG: hypothetical protein GWO07_09215 [Candidatus Dadabacteria bacterium]|nr:hypothetical protein [Candidatus Dadabacteria bacterium]NIS08926.1 hypothetical protein [Candidatus Dadabacteria bacterium]NIV40828.1 hypothetical protein [Candidatus Dadabacteria bacterium]NIX15476.1 hypothetical protein [Candidatus Dadabacteria bacterium]NIY22797.1 hypothetical protein [Candidatus Dadabacteria bacterium]